MRLPAAACHHGRDEPFLSLEPPSDWRSQPIRPHSIDPALKRAIFHSVRSPQQSCRLGHSMEMGVRRMQQDLKTEGHGCLLAGIAVSTEVRAVAAGSVGTAEAAESRYADSESRVF